MNTQNWRHLALKQGNCLLVPRGCCVWGQSPAPAACSGIAGSSQTVRPEGCGELGHSALVALGASGHVALLLLALRPSGSSFPALPGPRRPLGGATRCSSIRFLQLRPVGSRGGAGAAPGSCACTESALFPLCLSAPGRLAQKAAPTTAQGLESGTFSDRLHSC